MIVSGFDWDDGNWPKCGRHGVSREEIEAIFTGMPAVFPDAAHSHAETRYLAIGRTPAGRHALVAFALRRHGPSIAIRPISARYMHRKEVLHYERQQARQTPGPHDG